MEFPKDLSYTKSHEWVKKEGEEILVGLTDYAQNELGDLVFVNLPSEGDAVSSGEAFADVESVKAVSDIYSPVTGTISEVNEALQDDPASINTDPYGAWFVRVKDLSKEEELMNAADYEEFCKNSQE